VYPIGHNNDSGIGSTSFSLLMTSSDINGTIGGVTIDGDDNGTSIKAAG
jgi:hypothetical protein